MREGQWIWSVDLGTRWASQVLWGPLCQLVWSESWPAVDDPFGGDRQCLVSWRTKKQEELRWVGGGMKPMGDNSPITWVMFLSGPPLVSRPTTKTKKPFHFIEKLLSSWDRIYSHIRWRIIFLLFCLSEFERNYNRFNPRVFFLLSFFEKFLERKSICKKLQGWSMSKLGPFIHRADNPNLER